MDKSVFLTCGHTSTLHLHLQTFWTPDLTYSSFALVFRYNNLAKAKEINNYFFSAFNNCMLFPSYCVELKIEIASHRFIITDWRILPQVSNGLFFCLKTIPSWLVFVVVFNWHIISLQPLVILLFSTILQRLQTVSKCFWPIRMKFMLAGGPELI